MWQEKVATLKNGWEVAILETDLSEIEAFELEETLVWEHGGPASEGGKLTNWLPGGEDPVSVKISFDAGLKFRTWHRVYWEARRFTNAGRDAQESIAMRLQNLLEPVFQKLTALEEVAEQIRDESLADSVLTLDSNLQGQRETTDDFLRRRVFWHDFAMNLEFMLDGLEPEDLAELHENVRPLAEAVLASATVLLEEIDSGNRKEAEAEAERVAANAVEKAIEQKLAGDPLPKDEGE